jgi:hypothetical protein
LGGGGAGGRGAGGGAGGGGAGGGRHQEMHPEYPCPGSQSEGQKIQPVVGGLSRGFLTTISIDRVPCLHASFKDGIVDFSCL